MSKRTNNREIGERIRFEREKLGLTREKLAELVNLSPHFIGQLERGERRMSLNTLINFSSFFNISMDYFIKGEDSLYSMKGKRETSIMDNFSDKERLLLEDIAKAILPHIKNKKA